MAKSLTSIWTRAFQRNARAMTKATMKVGRKVAAKAVKTGQRAAAKVVKAAADQHKPPPGPGEWLAGFAFGPAGTRRYHLYRPPGVALRERRPMLVMLHGCNQTGRSFALSTRMNKLAARARFFVLYPEQDLMANPQGCWNWYDTRSGQSYAEAATINAAIDQACLLYPVDRDAIAIAGLSAGASMAALMATRYPERFKAVAMHSGVPPGTAQSSANVLRAMRGHRAPSVPVQAEAAVGLPPLLIVHGGIDLIVSVRNARAAAEAWAEAAGASATEQRELRRGTRHPMHVTDFKHRGRTVVSLCEIAALGHAWSGGDGKQAFSDPSGPDASRLVWAFVARQLKRRKA